MRALKPDARTARVSAMRAVVERLFVGTSTWWRLSRNASAIEAAVCGTRTSSTAPTTDAKLDAVDPATYAPEVMAVGQREVYVWYPDGVRRAKLSPAFFEKRYPADARVAGTARNWNTLTTLLTMLE